MNRFDRIEQAEEKRSKPEDNDVKEQKLEDEFPDDVVEDESDGEFPEDVVEDENDGEFPDDDVEDANEDDLSDDKRSDTEEIEHSDNSRDDEITTPADNESEDHENKDTRALTDDEKDTLKEKLGWSDKQIAKCTIDKDGVIHYKTDRSDLEGKTSENGVPYERKTIEINGVKIEGVFPIFDSVFDTQLDSNNFKTKTYANECNTKLKEAVNNNPDLKSIFTEEQLKNIEDGQTPTGYVWHHNEEPGKMQLVKREDHDKTIGGAAHTGGNSLWGADSGDSRKKGETF